MKKILRVLAGMFFIGLIAVIVGCGPTTFTRVRVDFQQYDKNEDKQTREGITIERHDLKEAPPEFYANVQVCDPDTGRLRFDFYDKPIMEKTLVVPRGVMIDKISITNKTGHIVRLNSTIIAVFDPADNQFNMLDKQEIFSYLIQERLCPNTRQTRQLQNQLNIIKLIDRNTELLPNRTTTGYLMYKPHDTNIPGIWKLSFYELPVETNAAGAVTKTVNFDFRSVLKKYIDTYKQENAFAKPVKVSTEEAQ